MQEQLRREEIAALYRKSLLGGRRAHQARRAHNASSLGMQRHAWAVADSGCSTAVSPASCWAGLLYRR